MGKQKKRKLATLLTFCFIILLTATSVSIGQEEYQDKAWTSSCLSNLVKIKNDLAGLNDANETKDMPNITAYGTALNTDSQNALVASKSFSVSPSVQPHKNEYEVGLSYLSQAGAYYAKGATEFQNGQYEQSLKDFETGKVYGRSCFTHLGNYYKYMLKNNSPS